MDKRAATVLALIGTFLVATAGTSTSSGSVANKKDESNNTKDEMNTTTNTSTSPGPVTNTTEEFNNTKDGTLTAGTDKDMSGNSTTQKSSTGTPTAGTDKDMSGNSTTQKSSTDISTPGPDKGKSPSSPSNTPDHRTATTQQTNTDISTPGPDKGKSPSSPSNTPNHRASTTQQTNTGSSKESDSSNALTYIIVFVIVAVFLVGAIVYCCFQSKTRRFSLDHHGKHEDAEIPLSQVDPDVFEATPPKGTDLQTFSAAESSLSNTSAPPADGQEIQEGDKAETNTNQQETEGSTDTQSTLPLTEKPSELTVVDLTDGEPDISTKTSVESLDEPVNENNSNNRAYSGWKMYDFSGHFTEIHLNDEP